MPPKKINLAKRKTPCAYLDAKKRNVDLEQGCHFEGEFNGSLTSEEKKLQNLFFLNQLYQTWGYRMNNQNASSQVQDSKLGRNQTEHTLFEADLTGHFLYPVLTPFSDPLMRTLQQGGKSYGEDISGKFLSLGYDPRVKEDAQTFEDASRFLLPFVEKERKGGDEKKNKTNWELLCWLASQDLEKTHSWLFGSWVLSARALLSFYEKNMQDINTISDYARTCIDNKEKLARDTRSSSRSGSRSASRSRSRSRSRSGSKQKKTNARSRSRSP